MPKRSTISTVWVTSVLAAKATVLTLVNFELQLVTMVKKDNSFSVSIIKRSWDRIPLTAIFVTNLIHL